ncbi:MAG: ribonuclease HII [Candidatus Pacearchaeota archaeon]|nr:ribonuclease HII [Candidatus Pacearchaeota archaeon]
MAIFIGIDDSGRGPIIGPMVIAGVLVTKKQKKELKKIGCKDSKKLSPKKRQILYEKIKKIVLGYEILTIPPEEIDERTNTGINLNKIEAIKIAEIINTLIKGLDNNKSFEVVCFIDCPSTNISAWQTYLRKHLKKFENIKTILKCEHNADSKYVECSAASILAKVTRDNEIEKIKKQFGIDFGSGYPSDPLTIEFLKKNADRLKNAKILRKTWETWKKLIKKQKTLSDFLTHDF